MGKLSRKKRIRREQGLKRTKPEKPAYEPQYADGCWCGAAIAHGEKTCRYCIMREGKVDAA